MSLIIIEIPSSNFSVFAFPLNLDSSLLLQVSANMLIHLKILKKAEEAKDSLLWKLLHSMSNWVYDHFLHLTPNHFKHKRIIFRVEGALKKRTTETYITDIAINQQLMTLV